MEQGSMAMAKNQAKSLSGLSGAKNQEEMQKAAQDFEAVFLSQMFSAMFKGVGVNSMFGGGQSEEMFRSMLLDAYAKKISKRGGIGIGDAVMRTLLKQQEKQS